MRVPAIRHHHIAGLKSEVFERLAAADITDQNFLKHEGHEIHTDMEPMVGSRRSRGLHCAGVDDEKPQPRRQLSSRGGV
jgi:hypothetical protein